MQIYPAIDIKDGKCVRLTRGDYGTAVVYEEEPWKAAVKWRDMGAEWLHVVDLDGAKAGAPQNITALNEILRCVDIPVQFGGGARQFKIIESLLALGVSRVIVGTAVAKNILMAAKFFREFGDKVAVGIDARDGVVAVSGWLEDTQETAISFANKMIVEGAKRLIYTDIASDGTLNGVNIERIREMCLSADVPVISAGGVKSCDDVRKLLPLTQLGLEGMIVGKALYTGDFDLQSALLLAKQ